MAEARATIVIDADDRASKKLRGVEGSLTQFEGKLENLAKISAGIVAGAGVAAAGAAGLIIKKGVEAWGDLEQNLGGAEAVFESFADTIIGKSQEAAKVMGISQNQYLETANKMGSLFQGTGATVDKSLEMTQGAMQRAADVASVMGIDLSMAMESVTGMAKGNFTMMDNLGVAMNDANIAAWMLSKGIEGNVNTMTTGEKVGMAYQMFMEQTAKYAGNFESESNTLNGSLEILKATWQNLTTVLGKELAPVAQDIIGKLSNTLKTLEENKETIVQVASVLADAFITAIETTISVLETAWEVITRVFNFLKDNEWIVAAIAGAITAMMIPAIVTLTTAFGAWAIAAAAAAAATLLPLIPFALVGAAIGVLAYLVIKNWDKIKEVTKNTWEAIKNFVQNAWNKVSEFASTAVERFRNKIQELWNTITGKFADIRNFFNEKINEWKQAGVDMVQGIIDGVMDKFNNFKSTIQDMANTAKDAFKNILGIHSPSRVFESFGQDTIAGLVKGIEGSMGLVDNAMNMTGDAMISSPSVASVAQPANTFTPQQSSTPRSIEVNFNNVTVRNDNDLQTIVNAVKESLAMDSNLQRIGV